MADRLISADAMKEYVREQVNLTLPKDRLYMVVPIEDFITTLIDNALIAEPKRGHNLADEQPRLARIFYCSECGYGFNDIFLCNEADYSIEPNYCPNCGARMDESTMGQLKPQEPINEPSEPDYTITCADAPMTYTCNRSVCMRNEYNGIDCDECEVRNG